MDNLVIVESPTKAKTLARFLGDKYRIEASMGHIRDLPKSDLGVDIEKDFEPLYVIPRDKRKRVNELKRSAEGVKNLWLASDPDREGEAIAWHIAHIFSEDKKIAKDVKVHRVEFHEITPEAIKSAFEHPREIDLDLVNAQQARRVRDRIVGYKLSPLLWKKITRGLSAGRVQSIALRLIVEREREIDKFKAVEYWNVEADLQTTGEKNFKAQLVEKGGKKLEIGNEKEAREHVSNLENEQYIVSNVAQREVKRSAPPPFTTSTLQQTAGNRLHYSAKRTMMLAQNLYERGFITYMRTNSVNIASSALEMTRSYIVKSLGAAYLPEKPRFFKSKVKNAQEAHEAIRPTAIVTQGADLRSQPDLTKDHIRLYDLIWKRTVASQVADTKYLQTSVDIAAGDYTFRASGSVILFDGWLKVYGVTELEEEGEDSKKQILPPLSEQELLTLLALLPSQHFTEPHPRYTEASLIKKLEELGIGRPSTYAHILSTIQDRFYVERIERKFKPSVLGMSVNDFLMKYFPIIFDYSFTASMENELDEISRGERNWRETMKTFYVPFEKTLEETGEKAEHVKVEVEVVDKKCPECGKDMVVRYGRFGKFLACSGFPECKHTEALEEKVDAICPEDGGDMVVRKTKRGKIFYGCKNYPQCKYASWTKPKGG